MPEARLAAGIWVAAYLRRLALADIPAYVTRRGDDTAGAVMVKCATLDGRASLWTREWDLDSDQRLWIALNEAAERDIDAEIGAYLAKDGVPTVGIDSLRYFWHELTPEKSAADVARIIDVYTKKWKVHKVALVGYSFGADVLPAIYAAMTPEQRAPVSLMSLLAYSGERQFEIQVSGILGGGPNFDGPSTIPDLEKTAPPAIVQCVYGTEDTESACLRVHLPGAQFVARPGGHHFDDVYEPVAQAILDRIKQP